MTAGDTRCPRRRAARAPALGLVLCAAACDGRVLIIGQEDAASDAGPSASGADAALAPTCPGRSELQAAGRDAQGPSELSQSHVGRWTGSLEGRASIAFPGSDIELELLASGSGTLAFTAGAPAATPLDVERGYLCDGRISGGLCGTPSGYVGGFSYELAGIVSRGKVVSFVILDAGPWDAWCQLHPPVAWANAAAPCGYSFGARLPAEPSWSPAGCERLIDGVGEPIDCGLMYALGRCECAHDGCFASRRSGIAAGLNLSDDDQELIGSLWFKNEEDAGLMRLRRSPP